VSKRLEQMRNNPRDWRIEDVVRICNEYEVRCEPPRGRGGHYKVTHHSQREILTVPFNRPIKVWYIKQLVAFIDAVRVS